MAKYCSILGRLELQENVYLGDVSYMIEYRHLYNELLKSCLRGVSVGTADAVI